MWRNVFYDNNKRKIFLWSWDKNGNRKEFAFDFDPFLYVETNNAAASDAQSLFGTKLKKMVFSRDSDRNAYVRNSGLKRIFYNLRPEQQFLLDLYKDKDYDWSGLPFKTFIIDAEVYSPNEFPNADEAKHPINVLSVYDNISGVFNVWGLKDYDKSTLQESLGKENYQALKEDKIKYTYCKSETELLTKFLEYWTNDYPDCVAGWNIEGFDIPYLINRIAYVLDEEAAQTLSPVGRLYLKQVANAKFGKELNKWFIRGVTLLDYMDLYRTFSRGEQDSYSLNNIAKVEEIGSKLEFDGQLHKLADENWNHFVNYNIHDVNLVKLLDEKLQYITIARFLAYKGFSKIEDALGKIAIVTGAMCKEANKMGRIIPTFPPTQGCEDYVGGYVKEPQRGLQEAVVSYDANSLYPNTIITLNLSPETKIGKILFKDNEGLDVKFTNGKMQKFTPEQFNAFCKKGKIAVSSANVLYRQDFKGICPRFIDLLYQERVEIQRQLQDLEVQEPTPEIKSKVKYLDQMQHTIKIFLNSAYGTYANKYSPFYDIDMAASITETGQAVIKEAGDIINQFLSKGKDCIIYSDTDSCYVTINEHLKSLGIKLSNSDGSITKEAIEQTEILQKISNEKINDWAKNTLHSVDPRYFFKRENICDAALFLEKKRYILSVRHDGKRNKHKYKYVGVEVQRSTYSATIKKLMKEVITTIFQSKDQVITDAKYKEVYEKFKTLDIDEIAFRSSVKDYNKYASISEGFTIGDHTPIHVKSSIYFNHLLKLLKLDSKYPPIVSGNKIKYVYTANNKYGIKCIGFTDKLPKEFNIAVDIEKMFEKIIAPGIESIYNCIGWNIPDMRRQYQTDFLSLFGS